MPGACDRVQLIGRRGVCPASIINFLTNEEPCGSCREVLHFTFDELITLLRSLGYSMETAGKTGGSRVAFANHDGDYIRLHKPHPRNILKSYQVDDIVANLTEKGLL